MSASRKLYVQCNPLLDIAAEVDGAFLAKYDLEVNTSHVYYAKYRGLFEELEAKPDVTTTPGGAGLNTARVAQWILNASSAHPEPQVTYVGCIGNDEHGNILNKAADADHVDMQLEVKHTVRTGVCAVCMLGKSKAMVAHLAASSCLTLEHMATPAVHEAIEQCTIAYTTAYSTSFHQQQTMQLAAATRVVQENRPKKLFAMSLSSQTVLEQFGEYLVDVLNKLDIIFCRPVELRDFAMMLQWVPEGMTDEELASKVAREMMYDKHAVRRVIITRGEQPILYATSEGETGEVCVEPVEEGTVKLFAAGARDAFIGGFLAAFTVSTDMEFCCTVGTKASAYVIQNGLKTLKPEAAPALSTL